MNIEKWLQQEDDELVYEANDTDIGYYMCIEAFNHPVMSQLFSRLQEAQDRREEWLCNKILSDYDKWKEQQCQFFSL